ncbi:hypothetical protein ACH4YO_35620 [Streptomyces noursei]|nr:hypothetical protein SNOUR_29240 [Streptomyces noursei ATCC 11455]
MGEHRKAAALRDHRLRGPWPIPPGRGAHGASPLTAGSVRTS